MQSLPRLAAGLTLGVGLNGAPQSLTTETAKEQPNRYTSLWAELS